MLLTCNTSREAPEQLTKEEKTQKRVCERQQKGKAKQAKSTFQQHEKESLTEIMIYVLPNRHF